MSISPPDRPHVTRELVHTLAPEFLDSGKVFLLGRRGYYGDTLGKKGQNDINIYDDAISIVGPDDFLESYNANTDPSKLYKNVARLEPGTWTYKLGTHNQSKAKDRQYTALVQAGEVVVFREGTAGVIAGVSDERGVCQGEGRWKGWFGINIHHGSYFSTSSAGCQTIFPDQWPYFIRSVKLLLSTHGQRTLPYVLTSRY